MKTAKVEEGRASHQRTLAAQERDYPTLLGYDDVFASRGGKGDHSQREVRKRDFAAWINAALAELGPPTTKTVQSVFGTLVAFRHEALREVVPLWQRELAEKQHLHATLDAQGTERIEDLTAVDKVEIAPRLEVLAPELWTTVAAKETAGDTVEAVQLGRAITRELPPTSPLVAELATLQQRIAKTFLDRASSAGDGLAGARVLHAKLATALGADAGPLATPTPELLAETGAAWQIVAPEKCGGTVDIEGNATSLEKILRSDGWLETSEQSAPFVRVTIEKCELETHDSESNEEIPYTETQTIKRMVPTYDEQCTPSEYHEKSEDDGDYVVTTKWKTPEHCDQVVTGQHEESEDVTVTGDEPVTVHHHKQSLTLTGSINMIVEDPKTKEAVSLTWDIDASGESTDDPTYQGVHVHQASGHYTAMEATNAAHDMLVAQIRQHRLGMFAARAAETVTRAQALAADGKGAEADDAFYVAAQMGTVPGEAPNIPEPMATWMTTTYRVPPAVLVAALAGQPLPGTDLAVGHEVQGKDIQIALQDYNHLNDITGGRAFAIALSGMFAGAVTKTETATRKSTGGLVNFEVLVPTSPHRFFAFRFAGGSLGTGGGHGFIDSDFQYGLNLSGGGFALRPLIGIGGDFTTGSQELKETPENFIVRPGLFVQYGARLAYAFPKNGKLEAFYSKVFRGSGPLSCEKRGQVTFTYWGLGKPLAASLRYTEYLPDIDDAYTPFSANGRIAKSTWFIVGFGI